MKSILKGMQKTIQIANRIGWRYNFKGKHTSGTRVVIFVFMKRTSR